MTFRATIAIEPLMTALEVLNGFQFDVTLHVDARGLRAGVMNAASTLAAEISFPPEAFRSFEFDGPSLSLLLCLSALLDIMAEERLKAGLLHLQVRKGSRKLLYRFSEGTIEINPSKELYSAVKSPMEVSYSDFDAMDSHIVNYEPTFRAVSPADCFTRLLAEVKSWAPRVAGVFLQDIRLQAMKDGIMYVQTYDSAGNSRGRHVDMTALGLITDYSRQGSSISSYAAYRIRQMGLPLAEMGQECQLTWEFGTDIPMRATYALPGGGGHVKFFLSPVLVGLEGAK